MISIIIPVLNEEKTIEKLLVQINELKEDKEIIVVDGGSRDRTSSIASRYAKVIHSQKGRANQMNAGVKKASGDILWFIHSDSMINGHALDDIEKTIEAGYIGGGFSLYFYDFDSILMRYIAKTSNWRAKYIGLFFGDQGLFVKRHIFQQVGGYPLIEIMEDWELAMRLKRVDKMKLLGSLIGTSGRRFKKKGVFKTLLFMHKIKFLYMIGVPPDKLSEMYREVR